MNRKRSGASRAVVSVYEAPDDLLNGRYATLNFTGPTKEWLDFVVKNRKGLGDNEYELTLGPVANDKLAFHHQAAANELAFVQAVEV